MVAKNLLTSEEAAVYLGVRLPQLKDIRSLPVVMIDRDTRYRVRDLDQWILSRRIVPLAGVVR